MLSVLESIPTGFQPDSPYNGFYVESIPLNSARWCDLRHDVSKRSHPGRSRDGSLQYLTYPRTVKKSRGVPRLVTAVVYLLAITVPVVLGLAALGSSPDRTSV